MRKVPQAVLKDKSRRKYLNICNSNNGQKIWAQHIHRTSINQEEDKNAIEKLIKKYEKESQRSET